MSDLQAGRVVWNLDAVDNTLSSGMAKAEGIVKASVGNIDHVLGSAASSVGSALGGIASSIGNIAWSGLQTGATVAGAAVAGLAAKGLSSANELQSMQISMNGLTHSMNLGAQAMATAYKYAQNAPFQLPEVAGVTKELIAYGLQVNDVGSYLQTLGDVSIASGTSLTTLGEIFGRISAQGRVMQGDIYQLTQNGVAILPALAKVTGHTQAAVSDMVTKGTIDFATFNKAMQSLVDPHILEQLNNTLPRQIDRLGGSIRIVSDAFVGVGVDAVNGFTQASTGIAQAATTLVGKVATSLRDPQLTSAVAGLGNSFVPLINSLTSAIPPIVNGIAKVTTAITTMGSTALPLLGLAVAGFSGLAGDIPVVGQLLGGLTAKWGLVIGLFGLLFANSAALRASFGQALQVIGQALAPLGPVLAQIGQIAGSIGNALAPVVVTLATAFGQLLAAVLPLVPVLLQLVLSIIQQALVPALNAMMPLMPALASAFGQIFSALLPLIPILITFAGQIIQQLLVPLIPIIVSAIGVLAKVFAAVYDAVRPLLPPLMTLAVTILQQLLLPVLNAVAPLLPALANAFMQIIAAVVPLLPPIISLVTILITNLAPILPQLVVLFVHLVVALLPLLPPLVQLITVLLPPLISLITVASNLFSAVLVSALTIVIGVLDLVITFVGKLVNAIVDVINWAVHFSTTFVDAFSGMKKSAGEVVNDVIGFFKRLPSGILRAIGDAGYVLYDIGRQIVLGLLDGSGSLLKDIGKFFLDKLPGWMRDPFKKALGIHSPSTVFAGYGRNIVQGLVDGMNSSSGLVGDAVSSLSDQLGVSGTMSMSASTGSSVVPSIASYSPGSSTPSSSAPQPMVIHIHQDGIIARSRSEFREIMKDGISAVNEELRARRQPQIANGSLIGSSTAA